MQGKRKMKFCPADVMCQKHATDKAKGYLYHKAPASSYSIGTIVHNMNNEMAP